VLPSFGCCASPERYAAGSGFSSTRFVNRPKIRSATIAGLVADATDVLSVPNRSSLDSVIAKYLAARQMLRLEVAVEESYSVRSSFSIVLASLASRQCPSANPPHSPAHGARHPFV
jgi:hypothetical protein